MPKSNDQIRREYDAQPWYSQLGTAAGDLANIAANGLTFGLANRAAEKIAGAPSGAADDFTHEARVRAGIAGDVANVAGMVYGGKTALNAGQAAIGAIKAAPTVANLARTAGLPAAARFITGTAGPALVPVVEAARPSLATVGKAAGLAALMGLSIAGRQDPSVAVATPAAKDKSSTTDKANPSGVTKAVTPYDRQLAALDAILRSPNMTLSDLQAVTGMLPKPSKPATATEQMTGLAAQSAAALYAQAMKDANNDPKLGAKAMEEYFNRTATLARANPMYAAQAQILDPTQVD